MHAKTLTLILPNFAEKIIFASAVVNTYDMTDRYTPFPETYNVKFKTFSHLSVHKLAHILTLTLTAQCHGKTRIRIFDDMELLSKGRSVFENKWDKEDDL